MIRMSPLAAMTLSMAMAMASATALAGPMSDRDDPVAARGTHHYIYYPAKRLYFAPETQMWFWRDGGDWTSGAALPILYQQYARGGYNVYLDVARPYEAQQEVDAGSRRHQWTPYRYDGEADNTRQASDRRRGHGGKR